MLEGFAIVTKDCVVEYCQTVTEGLVVYFLVVSGELVVEDCFQKLKMKDFHLVSEDV